MLFISCCLFTSHLVQIIDRVRRYTFSFFWATNKNPVTRSDWYYDILMGLSSQGIRRSAASSADPPKFSRGRSFRVSIDFLYKKPVYQTWTDLLDIAFKNYPKHLIMNEHSFRHDRIDCLWRLCTSVCVSEDQVLLCHEGFSDLNAK